MYVESLEYKLPRRDQRVRVAKGRKMELDDEALVLQAQTSENPKAALDQLYRRHYARVLAWCQRLHHNEQDAMDVAQEVFMRLEKSLQSFRRGSRFTTWLYVVARRAAIDSLRGQQRRVRLADSLAGEPVEAATTPEVQAQQAESDESVRSTMLRLLQPEEAQVLYMHYSLGMTLPSIAQQLNLENASGAKAPLVSAMRKLRRHYKVSAQSTRSNI